MLVLLTDDRSTEQQQGNSGPLCTKLYIKRQHMILRHLRKGQLAKVTESFADNLKEKKEKAVMTLQPGTGYKLPKKKKATVTIANVLPTPTPSSAMTSAP